MIGVSFGEGFADRFRHCPGTGIQLPRVSTIAANRSEMAADSQSTAGATKSHTPRPKVQRINGHLVAAVGKTDAIPAFFEWYEKGRSEDDRPELGESFEALTLTPEGLFQYYERLEPIGIVEDFWAIGQGSDIALGAMAAGASPKRAVEIACELNIYTGPPVVVERLQEQEA